ncbi:MAG: hypothetical protein WBF07_03485, partial [Xanthobacteraceae bacterium]
SKLTAWMYGALSAIAGYSPLASSRLFGVFAGIAPGAPLQHAAAPIIDDQRATHNMTGMIISPQ